jgi:hypothetical protein
MKEGEEKKMKVNRESFFWTLVEIVVFIIRGVVFLVTILVMGAHIQDWGTIWGGIKDDIFPKFD